MKIKNNEFYWETILDMMTDVGINKGFLVKKNYFNQGMNSLESYSTKRFKKLEDTSFRRCRLEVESIYKNIDMKTVTFNISFDNIKNEYHRNLYNSKVCISSKTIRDVCGRASKCREY